MEEEMCRVEKHSSPTSNNCGSPKSPSKSAASSWHTLGQSSIIQKRKAGRKKFQETRHPVYKGVRQRNGKWVCELREPNKKSRIWMGTFSSPEMAARAHDVAALALRGESASLNFPEEARWLPRARSSSITDIQCAAMAAAEAFGNPESSRSVSPSSTSCMVEHPLENAQESERKLFLDEEELFNMPAILHSMAEGLIVTPPSMQKGYYAWNDMDDAVDLTLWND